MSAARAIATPSRGVAAPPRRAAPPPGRRLPSGLTGAEGPGTGAWRETWAAGDVGRMGRARLASGFGRLRAHRPPARRARHLVIHDTRERS
jgi:hypothetical protein